MGISVYSITHTASGRFYVGQSVKTAMRLSRHRNMLKRGDHHCLHLQRAWNAYGEEAFEFSRIQSFGSAEEAIKAEQLILDALFSEKILFNSANSNDPKHVIAYARTKEACKRHSITRSESPYLLGKLAEARSRVTAESHKKRVATWRINGMRGHNKLPVQAINYKSGVLITYPSLQEAARATGACAGNIHQCCNGLRKSANGFTFTYEWMLTVEDSYNEKAA